ncbi:MAG TPA: MFS transporter [Segeticoccus sp.]|uniref:MFS transporter n=1 Tax=Segeticoccus sp. TaxID=2706531 RepID=UPI002D80CC9A|nr:MFS transporter [Segeticoccus sp.]HET8601375.1 MFS transporter [Segeticoccus sp.]
MSGAPESSGGPGELSYRSAQGRWVLAATVLGSAMALLDSTVVNVALRQIGRHLDAGLAQLQWITNGYLLSLASLILVGGSLGDRLGRRRVFTVGVIWFAIASALCAVALTPVQLIVARVLQGVGAALLTPGSLALIQSSFQPADRGRTIGAWAGLGGIATAIGPLVGGWLVQTASWRWVFLLNLPLAAVTVVVTQRYVPESRDTGLRRRYDPLGAGLAVVALAGITFALIEMGTLAPLPVVVVGALGAAAAAGFITWERGNRNAMVPMDLFTVRQFSAANGMTLLVYAALGAVLFFLVLQLQTGSGWSPLEAGLATVPITVLMLLFSSRGGQLASRIGPRLPMALGPLVCAVGTALLTGVGEGANYWRDVFPGVVVFGLGLVLLVAPLTSTVLAAAPDQHAGVASGVNNAVARAGSLLAVSALPAAVGLSGDDYQRPEVFSAGYDRAMWVCAGLLVLGGLVAGALIRNRANYPVGRD